MMAGDPGRSSSEFLPPPSISRLPTFKAPRDLTLSKGSRSRRHYVPNIPPKRDKTDTSSNPTPVPVSTKQFTQPSLPGPSGLRLRQPRPNVPTGLGIYGQRGGPRTRGPRPDLIQSTSIFSEGVGTKSLVSRRGTTSISGRGRGGRGGNRGNKATTSTADLEKVITKNSSSHQKTTEEDVADDEPIGGLGTFMEKLSQGPIPCRLQPVSLPLSAYLERNKTTTSQKKIRVRKAVPGCSFSEFVKASPKDTLVYLQLPDKLPFLKPGVKKKEKDVPRQANEYQNSMKDLRGGYVGKIQLLASGKTKLVLGRHPTESRCSFEIESSKAIAFRQELAAVDLQKKTLSMLGKVQHKFICVPELSALFKKTL